MKHTLLIVFSIFLANFAFAQSENSFSFSASKNVAVTVYPNPATDYIALNDDNERVTKIELYNLTGRQMRSFAASKGEKYGVYDLPGGVYFIRLLDKSNRIVTTQRINKR